MALNPWEYADKTGNEHAHQTALFMFMARARYIGFEAASQPGAWAKGSPPVDLSVELQPKLRWLHAIHNQGHGDVKRGARARAEGVRAGVPDLFLPVRIRDFRVPLGTAIITVSCGIYIELKRPDSVGKKAGDTSDVQDDWIAYLREAGFTVEVCYGWLEAKVCIEKYLAYKEALKPT